MFTGIIEALGTVAAIHKEEENTVFTIESPISKELKVDQSLSHNGVCLTVTHVEGNHHRVTAIQETLRKTNLGDWRVGTLVNLERSMAMGGRFDGHIVQGHVDQVGTCVDWKEEGGSWFYTFAYDASVGNFTVEKGSICINGVSLTVVNAQEGRLSVAIIPYTYTHTNFQQIRPGTVVNLEFDVLGKYLQNLFARYLSAWKPGTEGGSFISPNISPVV